ncbi:MAG: ubiquinol oxidase subunit II [Gammaproteobacteria bacterium]|nr:MAG: ubiquinol oxidase subunit II [Gammaproteobacteria bacterium]
MKVQKYGPIALLLFTVLFLGGCDFALFAPEGEIGQNIRDTIFITVGLMLLVVIPTLCLIVWVALKYRKGNNADYEPEWEHSNKIEMWAWGVPIVIIAILATITYFASYSMDPRRPIESKKETMTIQVVALEWKWLFIYPEQGIATINEIAVPVDTPVEFLITSNDSMNSFYIPRLGGQLYAMAGMENRLHLIANQKGVYRGISSNYSGFGFSGMRFKVHSVADEEFAQWVAKVKTSPKKLDMTSYKQLEKRTKDNPVEYFGHIDPLQFKNIIEKFKGVQ